MAGNNAAGSMFCENLLLELGRLFYGLSMIHYSEFPGLPDMKHIGTET
jgi:hypothetical protein